MHGLVTTCPVQDGIIYPLSQCNVCNIQIWEWIRDFTTHFIIDEITYPCLDYSWSMFVKREPEVSARLNFCCSYFLFWNVQLYALVPSNGLLSSDNNTLLLLCAIRQQVLTRINADEALWHHYATLYHLARLILGLRLANEGLRYFVTTSLIGWAR